MEESTSCLVHYNNDDINKYQARGNIDSVIENVTAVGRRLSQENCMKQGANVSNKRRKLSMNMRAGLAGVQKSSAMSSSGGSSSNTDVIKRESGQIDWF